MEKLKREASMKMLSRTPKEASRGSRHQQFIIATSQRRVKRSHILFKLIPFIDIRTDCHQFNDSRQRHDCVQQNYASNGYGHGRQHGTSCLDSPRRGEFSRSSQVAGTCQVVLEWVIF
jgi:hypothetical protein